MQYEQYKEYWSKKTLKQVRKEYMSLQKYIQKYVTSYAWHGNQHAPGEMSDGQRLSALREVIEEKESQNSFENL